jgi:hypothetical protein
VLGLAEYHLAVVTKNSQKHSRQLRPRAFSRDAYVGFRLPADQKARLWEVARKTTRDPSCYLREWIRDGLTRTERELITQQIQ